jgi:Mrp family chromosome partitioning ATPase
MSTLIGSDTAVPKSRSKAARGLATGHYDYLVHWLQSLSATHLDSHQTIGLTGCMPGAGVSTAAADLACAAAALCVRPVLLLDLSEVSTHGRRLGAQDKLQLATALQDRANASRYATACQVPNLSLLGFESGDDFSLAFDRRHMSELLAGLERKFAFIVVDLPTTETKQCSATAGLLGGVLLVMEAERTRSDLAATAKLWLTHSHATVLGVILSRR